MKTNYNISNFRGRASISSLNRIKRFVLWVVAIVGVIIYWVLIRQIFRGVGWIISILTAILTIYWILTIL